MKLSLKVNKLTVIFIQVIQVENQQLKLEICSNIQLRPLSLNF
jgi:hypothetical protein